MDKLMRQIRNWWPETRKFQVLIVVGTLLLVFIAADIITR